MSFYLLCKQLFLVPSRPDHQSAWTKQFLLYHFHISFRGTEKLCRAATMPSNSTLHFSTSDTAVAPPVVNQQKAFLSEHHFLSHRVATTVVLQPRRHGVTRVRCLPHLIPESSSVLSAPFHCLAFSFIERTKLGHILNLIHNKHLSVGRPVHTNLLFPDYIPLRTNLFQGKWHTAFSGHGTTWKEPRLSVEVHIVNPYAQNHMYQLQDLRAKQEVEAPCSSALMQRQQFCIYTTARVSKLTSHAYLMPTQPSTDFLHSSGRLRCLKLI